MPSVWIVEGFWDYEGSEVVAVFDNEDAAIITARSTDGYDEVRVKSYDVHSTEKDCQCQT